MINYDYNLNQGSFFWGGGGRREGQWYRARIGVGIEFRAIILISDARYVSSINLHQDLLAYSTVTR